MSKSFMLTVALISALLLKYMFFVDQKTKYVERIGDEVLRELRSKPSCPKK